MKDYKLSILDEFMFIGPLVVSTTQILSFKNPATETSSFWVRWFGNTSSNLSNIFAGIRAIDLPLSPFLGMVLTHVFGIVLAKSEIIYSIIRFYAVKMMHSFIGQQLSAKALFHDMAMFQHTFAVYIYSHIAKGGQTSLAFFKQSPVRGNIKTFVTCPPRPVHLTHSTLFRDILTILYSTKSHINYRTEKGK